MDIRIVVSKDVFVIKDAFEIRKSVFVGEQGFYDALDDIDEIAWHAVAYDGHKVVGCGRMFPEGEGKYHVGRIAVLKEYRGMDIGTEIMNAFERTAADEGACCIVLSAQRRARDFYLKLGYETIGDEYLEEGYPHTFMQKNL